MIQSWQFWAFGAAGFAALTAILAKIGVEGIDSDLATFIRTIVVVLALGALLAVTGKLSLPDPLPGRTLLWLAASGLATGASWLCYFRALKLGEASRVAPVDKLSVVFVAVFAALFLGERLSASGWLGIALITAGALVLLRR
ncbi:EamA family transporter [Paroceanicella profunda]|uniref:EamA family transporter n=1 Tax=Paroceanicella profunda TaxID=2579971 RepID=A0A5B8FGV8_9RHOB|nr:EamA family transporter [Paroceanicella profunda]QDL91447.1 EamA family transporter [Paroceanicella profunda]